MTAPTTTPTDKTTTAPPATPPAIPPHVVALLASVEVARSQLDVMAGQITSMRAALDAVLASAQAGVYQMAVANGSLRERIARDSQPAGGMPAVFGAQPGETNGNQSDPTGRLDAAP